MNFEWDETKNEQNIQRHNIDFADVAAVFAAPMLIDYDDRRDYDEDRWIGMGLLQDNVVVVIFTERAGDRIRLISARKANKHETERYFTFIAY